MVPWRGRNVPKSREKYGTENLILKLENNNYDQVDLYDFIVLMSSQFMIKIEKYTPDKFDPLNSHYYKNF